MNPTQCFSNLATNPIKINRVEAESAIKKNLMYNTKEKTKTLEVDFNECKVTTVPVEYHLKSDNNEQEVKEKDKQENGQKEEKIKIEYVVVKKEDINASTDRKADFKMALNSGDKFNDNCEEVQTIKEEKLELDDDEEKDGLERDLDAGNAFVKVKEEHETLVCANEEEMKIEYVKLEQNGSLRHEIADGKL